MRLVHTPLGARAARNVAATFAAAALLAGCGSDGRKDKAAGTGATGYGTTTAPTTTATTTTATTSTATTPASTTATTPATGGTDSGITVTIEAGSGGAIAFEANNLAIPSGRVTFKIKNAADAGTEHAIAIEGHGVDQRGPAVAPGGTSTVTATLQEGSYEFYCPVDAHRQQGMKGRLTVT